MMKEKIPDPLGMEGSDLLLCSDLPFHPLLISHSFRVTNRWRKWCPFFTIFFPLPPFLSLFLYIYLFILLFSNFPLSPILFTCTLFMFVVRSSSYLPLHTSPYTNTQRSDCLLIPKVHKRKKLVAKKKRILPLELCSWVHITHFQHSNIWDPFPNPNLFHSPSFFLFPLSPPLFILTRRHFSQVNILNLFFFINFILHLLNHFALFHSLFFPEILLTFRRESFMESEKRMK